MCKVIFKAVWGWWLLQGLELIVKQTALLNGPASRTPCMPLQHAHMTSWRLRNNHAKRRRRTLKNKTTMEMAQNAIIGVMESHDLVHEPNGQTRRRERRSKPHARFGMACYTQTEIPVGNLGNHISSD